MPWEYIFGVLTGIFLMMLTAVLVSIYRDAAFWVEHDARELRRKNQR